ncbi:MAG: hypothetical protein ACE5DI_02270 [Candidatus Micrarchaeia archaeon]
MQDFSCNGGEGNVEIGVGFNCNAVILNDDPNTDATLSSVTLSSLNGWTAQTSYSGTYSGNSVTKGGTKSVSFLNIIPTTPKASNKFTDLLINGAPENSVKISETDLNVVSINSLTVTASSSADQNAEFDVQATTILGGRADLNLTIALSGGCTLQTGESATAPLGTAADSTLTNSWKVVQGSSDCTSTVTAKASASPVLLTSSQSATTSTSAAVSYPSSFGGSSGVSTSNLPATTQTATPAPTETPPAETPSEEETEEPATTTETTPKPTTKPPSATPKPTTPAPAVISQELEDSGIDSGLILIAAVLAIGAAALFYVKTQKEAGL